MITEDGCRIPNDYVEGVAYRSIGSREDNLTGTAAAIKAKVEYLSCANGKWEKQPAIELRISGTYDWSKNEVWIVAKRLHPPSN